MARPLEGTGVVGLTDLVVALAPVVTWQRVQFVKHIVDSITNRLVDGHQLWIRIREHGIADTPFGLQVEEHRRRADERLEVGAVAVFPEDVRDLGRKTCFAPRPLQQRSHAVPDTVAPHFAHSMIAPNSDQRMTGKAAALQRKVPRSSAVDAQDEVTKEHQRLPF